VPAVVLVSVEPLAYREAIAGALRLLRPGVAVVEAARADRDAAIARLRPALVVCNGAAAAGAAAVWLQLYPGGGDGALLVEAGRARRVAAPGLDGLVALVDRAAARGPSPAAGRPGGGAPGP
jgi:hypothetical protein